MKCHYILLRLASITATGITTIFNTSHIKIDEQNRDMQWTKFLLGVTRACEPKRLISGTFFNIVSRNVILTKMFCNETRGPRLMAKWNCWNRSAACRHDVWSNQWHGAYIPSTLHRPHHIQLFVLCFRRIRSNFLQSGSSSVYNQPSAFT